MNVKAIRYLSVLSLIGLFARNCEANGSGLSSGLTLTEPSTALSASLAESLTAGQNQLAAFSLNPSSLQSLRTGQASFLYKQGVAEDAFGHFMMGSPYKGAGVGLSVGYYDGGDVELFNGLTPTTVRGQSDLLVAAGYARPWSKTEWGVTAKYFRSELAESLTATTFAVDLGMGFSVNNRMRLGAAMQNLGNSLTYDREAEPLPVVARVGASYLFNPGPYARTLYVDMPYHKNESELRPAVGLEMNFGPVALRTGYKHISGAEQFHAGFGFLVSRITVDYAFGFIKNLDMQQGVSLSMRWGEPKAGSTKRRELSQVTKPIGLVREKSVVLRSAPIAKPVSVSPAVQSRPVISRRQPRERVYQVQKGDTLASIARDAYGTPRLWKRIYWANKHRLADASSIEPGQKILIPE